MRRHELESHNELSGTVHGPAIQAGTVYGGIRIGVEAGSARQTPWQLPATVRVVDRARELAALERHRAGAERAGRPALAALSGLGGVGKTAVALKWLHALRPRFPGGQLYADLGDQSPAGPASPPEVLARFLRALGVPAPQVPATLAERVALYRSLTADRPLVVLLDDAVSAAQVRPLLPAGGSVTAVTSRRRMPGLTVDGCYPVHLEPLDHEAAVELLADTLSDGRVAAQPDDARALVELCAGLPLAVRVAGARLAARPERRITTMVRALAEEHDRLEALAIDGDHSVRAALDLSYEALPAPAARLYRLLGLHPGPEFGGPVAAALLGSEGNAERLLETLHDASLLFAAGEERHRFHDLVRLHAVAKADEDEPPQERARALRRMADHYLAGATRAEEIIDPQHRTMARDYAAEPVVAADVGDDAEAALNWLERELPNLMAVIRRARAEGFPTVGWQLADALWPLFLRRKFYDDWRAAHEEGLAAAGELGDVAAECRMLTSGGVGELGAGTHDRALRMFERAARLFLDSGDRLGRARTLNYRGLALQRLGRLDEAADLFGRAATELPACGDERAGGLARLNLADVALAAGRAAEAVDQAAAARRTLHDAGDTYNTARAALALGRAHLALDRLDEAEELLSSALATLRAMAANYEAARALGSLAEVAERRGRQRLALDRCREALDLYSSVGRSRSDEAEAARQRLTRLDGGGCGT
ncbi:tetratricopeptide repeat protein [Streptomyces sp. DH24]|uniref:ATP-binding protein n=1 Tax=Streptomyces sp. DH24 TaxID=3040123 RepID=UPI00244312FE|nr:tetratricopeptide repeat protein [Streptomyces sp. DH24]MDG9716410.1 tetratricopeptide repeat protein [Streptomyces sp. DH24]